MDSPRSNAARVVDRLFDHAALVCVEGNRFVLHQTSGVVFSRRIRRMIRHSRRRVGMVHPSARIAR